MQQDDLNITIQSAQADLVYTDHLLALVELANRYPEFVQFVGNDCVLINTHNAPQDVIDLIQRIKECISS